MKFRTRLMLALSAAAALGLSCTACLAPNSLNARSQTPVQTTRFEPPPSAETDVIRLGVQTTARRTLVSEAPAPIQYQAQSQTPALSLSHSRPLGELNGIDMAVAGFAESVTHTPYQKLSPLDLKQSDHRRIDAGYTLYANSEDTGLGLDISVRPRVTFDRTENFSSTRAGAEVRIGQDLDLRGKPKKNSNWYLFAGADGEAVVWDVQRAGTTGIADGLVTLQDRVTVGDVQAGVAWESPAGQMSISYIEREYEYRNGAISRTGDEDFVALTLTWRR